MISILSRSILAMARPPSIRKEGMRGFVNRSIRETLALDTLEGNCRTFPVANLADIPLAVPFYKIAMQMGFAASVTIVGRNVSDEMFAMRKFLLLTSPADRSVREGPFCHRAPRKERHSEGVFSEGFSEQG
jgi:hypothetical protein